MIGWNEACSAAVSHLRYPPPGRGFRSEPEWGRVGTFTLVPGSERPRIEWNLELSGASSVAGRDAALIADSLVRAGYTRPGFTDTVRAGRAARRPGMEELLLSASSIAAPEGFKPPPPPFRLWRAHFNELSSCAVLVFKREAAADAFRYQIARTSPRARRRRAEAHVSNGILLYQEGELDAGVEELEIAVAADPDLASARYNHAVVLGAQGRFDEALGELALAVKLDRRVKRSAREAVEFEDIRRDRRFRDLVR